MIGRRLLREFEELVEGFRASNDPVEGSFDSEDFIVEVFKSGLALAFGRSQAQEP